VGIRKIEWLETTYSDQLRLSNNPERLLTLIIDSWKEIDRVARPFIGKTFSDSLYQHSVNATVETHPWLAAASVPTQSAIDLDLLRRVLSSQEAEQFAAASDLLLLNFYIQLTNLIGVALTDCLIQPVLAPMLNASAINANAASP